MRTSYQKLFKDRSLLYEAANLRMNGWAFTSLSFLFNCDISSLRAQCDKYRVIPLSDKVYTIERITAKVLSEKVEKPKTKWAVIDGERVCLGRSYEDYFRG